VIGEALHLRWTDETTATAATHGIEAFGEFTNEVLLRMTRRRMGAHKFGDVDHRHADNDAGDGWLECGDGRGHIATEREAEEHRPLTTRLDMRQEGAQVGDGLCGSVRTFDDDGQTLAQG
jgi:hypothetical protein